MARQNKNASDEAGFITMIVMLIVVLAAVIWFAFKTVLRAQQ